MTATELRDRLLELSGDDIEESHYEADRILVAFIADMFPEDNEMTEALEAYTSLPKWFA